VTVSNDAWADVAEYLRSQRKLADISLRHLARLTNVSDSYLSQVERGLYQPSPDVLKSIARALGLAPWTLYQRLGWLDEESTPVEPAITGVEDAIARDTRLSATNKGALTEIYRALIGDGAD
jgi:transcriptional regulator with XRE-family HTH domain